MNTKRRGSDGGGDVDSAAGAIWDIFVLIVIRSSNIKGDCEFKLPEAAFEDETTDCLLAVTFQACRGVSLWFHKHTFLIN